MTTRVWLPSLRGNSEVSWHCRHWPPSILHMNRDRGLLEPNENCGGVGGGGRKRTRTKRQDRANKQSTEGRLLTEVSTRKKKKGGEHAKIIIDSTDVDTRPLGGAVRIHHNNTKR